MPQKKIYKIAMTDGEINPAVTVQENSLVGNPPTWARAEAGVFEAVFPSNTFPPEKTHLQISNTDSNNIAKAAVYDGNKLQVTTAWINFGQSTVTLQDGRLFTTYLTIEVYP